MKITVVTVAYNSAATIADTMDSVATQDYSDVEHLVVDGASRDDTAQIARARGTVNTRVISEPDQGIYDAMNKGITRAQGEVVGFLNADDLFADQQALSRVATAFDDPRTGACFGDLVYVSADNRRIVRYWKSRPHRAGSFARGWCPAHPTFYVRRSAIERLGLFDLSYHLAADIEFMLRYLERGTVRSTYIPRIQVRMRVGGATNRSIANIITQNREILDALARNGIRYSASSFFAHKFGSRIWQRLMANAAPVPPAGVAGFR